MLCKVENWQLKNCWQWLCPKLRKGSLRSCWQWRTVEFRMGSLQTWWQLMSVEFTMDNGQLTNLLSVTVSIVEKNSLQTCWQWLCLHLLKNSLQTCWQWLYLELRMGNLETCWQCLWSDLGKGSLQICSQSANTEHWRSCHCQTIHCRMNFRNANAWLLICQQHVWSHLPASFFLPSSLYCFFHSFDWNWIFYIWHHIDEIFCDCVVNILKNANALSTAFPV